MFYAWLYPLREQFHVFNVFRYVTFRSVYAALTAMGLCLILGPVVIKRLKSLKVGQTVRTDGPQTHLKKSGTPTMGGVLVLLAVIVSTLLWARLDNRYVWLCLGSVAWFGMLGAVDDYAKLTSKSGGLRARMKLLLQILGAILIMLGYFDASAPDPRLLSTLNLPFFKEPIVMPPPVYFLIGIVVIVGASNGVNLTDGLDGLAIGTSAMVSLALVVAAYLVGNFKLAEYLRIPFVAGMSEGAIFCSAVFGACLGFLWFNAHPAEVFMGDTGSLALGGLFGTVAVLAKQEVLLLVAGGIFVFETLSVALQVAGFKLWGKRIFKMAPLHHHFELGGWEEPKVVVRFWIMAIVLLLLSLSTFKLR